MSVIINVKDKRWNTHKIDFARIAENALILENKGSEVSITLTGDAEIRELNKKYRGLDRPTNVLSFETEDKELLGDVFISFDATMRESDGKDFAAHAAHLIVHGVLHLQGFDHVKMLDAWRMERREVKILRGLGIGNPYENAMQSSSCLAKWLYRIGLFALGAAGALGFAPYYLWPLTALSLGVAYYLSASRRNIGVGWWWGAGYGAMSFHWCLESIFANEEIARQLWYFYPIGLVAIAAASGVIFGLPFWMARQTGSVGWRRTLYFALAWAFVLWLREWLLTGFPWNPLANIVINSTAISGMMSVVGALGLTFVIAGAICSTPEFLRTRAKWQFLFFIPLLAAFCIRIPRVEFAGQSVRIVQPAFDMNQKFGGTAAEYRLKTLVELSAGANVDLIVWPETAYPYLINDQVKMPALGAPLFAGAMYYENGEIYNAMIAASDGGDIINKYFKHHLVPFGEYRPFGDIIPTPGQLAAGPGPKIIPFWHDQIVPAICYEIIFSDSLVPSGANPNFILNITNDAWFGTSGGPYQHLDMARRQAIETGLPVVRANYGGISAIIDSRGRVLQSLPLGARGILDGNIPPPRMTLYRRMGLNGTMLLIVLLCGTMLIAFRGRGKR